MAIKVAINGFGRIGRLVYRIAAARDDIEIVAINDLVPADNLGYLLKYDSTHGQFQGDVKVQSDALVVNGKKTVVCSERGDRLVQTRDTDHYVALCVVVTRVISLRFSGAEFYDRHALGAIGGTGEIAGHRPGR